MGCFQSKPAVETVVKPAKAHHQPTAAQAANGKAHAGAGTAVKIAGAGPIYKTVTNDPTLILGKTTPDIKTFYDFGKVLGKGQFGTTRLVTDKRTQEKLACKSISKRKLVTPEDIADVQREVQIMHHLEGHPNVVQLRNAYEDRQHVHLVMELCSGGELFDRIVQKGQYSEADAATLIRTMVEVVSHCHAMNVIHRDLKPENFLFSDKEDNAVVKATDFGLSVFFKDGQEFTDIVGSAYYVAPEVLRRRYSKEADIWSCGVILYILLCGVPPFYGDNEQQIFEAVIKGPVDFASAPWPKITEPAKECVRRMLVRDPRKRATAAEILQHPWIKKDGVAGDNVIEPEVLKRIKGFAAMNRLKKEALKVIAANLPAEEITGLKEMFQSIDTDRSGTITVSEMREGLRQKGTKIPEADLNSIMAHADVNGDGKIDYEEFLAATMHLGKLEREENLYKAFQFFDRDGSGYITNDELQAALRTHGDDAAVREHCNAILSEVDHNKDGRIDYEEFCAMMRAGNDEQTKAAAWRLKHGGLIAEPPVLPPRATASPRESFTY